jgi:hypothetical protein
MTRIDVSYHTAEHCFEVSLRLGNQAGELPAQPGLVPDNQAGHTYW